jgi:hypothetical protein
MEKISNEGGIDVTKTSYYGKVYMDQHKETLDKIDSNLALKLKKCLFSQKYEVQTWRKTILS